MIFWIFCARTAYFTKQDGTAYFTKKNNMAIGATIDYASLLFVFIGQCVLVFEWFCEFLCLCSVVNLIVYIMLRGATFIGQ